MYHRWECVCVREMICFGTCTHLAKRGGNVKISTVFSNLAFTQSHKNTKEHKRGYTHIPHIHSYMLTCTQTQMHPRRYAHLQCTLIQWEEWSSPLTPIYSQRFITAANEWGEMAALGATPHHTTAMLQQIISSATLTNTLPRRLRHTQAFYHCLLALFPMPVSSLSPYVRMLSVFQIMRVGAVIAIDSISRMQLQGG